MTYRVGLVLGALVALGASAGACSSDPDPETTPPPTPEEKCEGNPAAFRFPDGSPDGSADPFGAKAAGQARAGRLRDPSQIVQHSSARNKVRVGDYVLANDKIAVYIEGARESDGYDTFGGKILAMDPVGADGRPIGVSQYNETLIALARQTLAPEKVTVLADGSDGKAAIVRAQGTLKNIPFMDTFKPLAPEEYDFPVAFDWVLEPGASKVVLRLSLASTRPEDVTFNQQYVGSFHSNRHRIFTEALGFADPKGELSFVAFESLLPSSTFLMQAPGGGKIFTDIGISGFQLFNLKGLSIEKCGKKTVDYLELASSTGGLDGLLQTKRAMNGEPAWREVKGVVKEPDGTLLPGALVHALTPAGKYLTRAIAGADGSYVLHVPPGPANLQATLKGWALPAPVTVADGAGTADVVLPKRATLAIDAKDATTNEALPVRVQVIPAAPVARASASYGVPDEDEDGRLWLEFAATGKANLPVPPGQHRVIVTRGYEYELSDTTVTATANTTTPVPVSLLHSVDSTGVMCADFHIHSNFSADSDDDTELKLRGAVADGLEIPVSSEHEWIYDFQPIIERLGLTKWAYSFPSEELTTFAWGHFGVVPIYPRPDQPNNGAVNWVGAKPPEFFKRVNALPEKPFLIVNHPNQTGFTGYFGAAGFDRTTMKGNPELWSDEFAAIELFNTDDFEANRNKTGADWFALLDSGRTIWAIGNSDTHHIRATPTGYPRNCLKFGHDDPTRVTGDITRDILKTGAIVVSGGLTMTVEGPGGVGPGGKASSGAYKVTVQAPGWLSASTLETIVDGQSVSTTPLTPSAGPGPAKKYELTVNVAPTQSRARHYVVFHAKGSGDLAPLNPGKKSFAFSNPIFFDN
ncbi:MAG: CehA/McbA family metallohydrolase [Deltaproteobacteria bacterium]|nr:CehA/McbA family metallohydrolase [Deltaproteobacteria bacterium]